MNLDELKSLLDKYEWIFESENPLVIRSKNGVHSAQNLGAQFTIEYLILLDDSDNEEEKEDLIKRSKNEV